MLSHLPKYALSRGEGRGARSEGQGARGEGEGRRAELQQCTELQQCAPVTMRVSVNGIVTQSPFYIICCQAYFAHVNCAHSVQGRLHQVLSTEMYEVVECVQIVCK